MTLQEIIDALEKADGPDREIDADILEATGGCAHRETEYYCIEDGNDSDSGFTCKRCGKDTYGERVPAFTASVDAAIALCERVLPEWFIHTMTFETIGVRENQAVNGWNSEITKGYDGPALGRSGKLPIAICLSILRAKLQETIND